MTGLNDRPPGPSAPFVPRPAAPPRNEGIAVDLIVERGGDEGSGHRTSTLFAGSTRLRVSPAAQRADRTLPRLPPVQRCKTGWPRRLAFRVLRGDPSPVGTATPRCASRASYITVGVGHRRHGPVRCRCSLTKSTPSGRLSPTSLSHRGRRWATYPPPMSSIGDRSGRATPFEEPAAPPPESMMGWLDRPATSIRVHRSVRRFSDVSSREPCDGSFSMP